MLQRFLLLWLILLSLLASMWDTWFSGIPDPFRASAPGLNGLFAVTMLAIGSLLPADEIRQVARRWPTVLGGTTVQYLAMPLLAYSLAQTFRLEGAALIGILVAGSVPGAMASNVLTLIGRGNVSYSVSLTALATLVSPLVVPAALWLFLRRWVNLDVPQMMWQLSWMVVIPVAAGHVLCRTFSVWERAARRCGATIANLSVLWIIAVVVAGNRDRLTQVESSLLFSLLALNVLGFLAGFLGGWAMRLPPPMRRALVLEVGMQNAGLGTVLAAGFFGPEAALAPAIYTFGCMFNGTILARIWSRRFSTEELLEGTLRE